MTTAVSLRRLTAADAAAYRDIRLESLHEHPDAFSASFEIEARHPPGWFADRLENGFVVGGEGGGSLLGIAGYFAPDAPKLRHKGVLWGMYVRPAARGSGLGLALVRAIVDHARGRCEELTLGVATHNAAALRLYAAAGFAAASLQPRAIKVDNRYVDELTMIIRFTDPVGPSG